MKGDFLRNYYQRMEPWLDKSYRLFYPTLLFLWTYRAFKGSYKNSNFYELYKERNTDKEKLKISLSHYIAPYWVTVMFAILIFLPYAF